MGNYLITKVKDRLLKKNQNWLAVITGPTGSGKSLSAISLAKALDPEFNEERIVFTPRGFVELINSGKLKAGNIIVFDEAGAGIPARAWMSISNKCINLVLQTFRHENLGVIFTVPNLSYIDSQARGLLHAYLETIRIDRRLNVVIAKWLNVQTSPRFGKTYFKYPRYRSNSGPVILTYVKIRRPDKGLEAAYEVKKRAFTKELNTDIESDLRALRKKKRSSDKLNPDEIAKSVLADPAILGRLSGVKYKDLEVISQSYGVGRAYALRAFQLITVSKPELIELRSSPGLKPGNNGGDGRGEGSASR